MRLEGAYKIAAPREKVWERLLDPQALARALPGCEKLEANADGSYATEMRVGIAAVKGTYKGRVEILDAVPPDHFRMKVEAQGTGGFLRGAISLAGASREAEESGPPESGGAGPTSATSPGTPSPAPRRGTPAFASAPPPRW